MNRIVHLNCSSLSAAEKLFVNQEIKKGNSMIEMMFEYFELNGD